MTDKDPVVVDMIALYSRFSRMKKPRWRATVTLYLKRIRLFHSRVNGGVLRSYYTFESTKGELIDLVYNEDELTWHKMPDAWYHQFEVSTVLALILKENDQPSRAHRVIPLRLGLMPAQEKETGLPLSYRIQPYRFQGPSAQVVDIPSRKLEITPEGKQLHYVVQSDTGIYYHMAFKQDSGDWLLVKTVDAFLNDHCR